MTTTRIHTPAAKTALATFLATAAFLGTCTTQPGLAASRTCQVYAKSPNTLIISTRNLTCAKAATIMGSYSGQIHRRFTVKGFRCLRQTGGQTGGKWSCARGSQAFGFSFRD